MTRLMRCRDGLEFDEPAPPDREGPNPDPCKIREKVGRLKGGGSGFVEVG